MLETRIEELTAAVRELTAVLAAHPVATNPVVVKDPQASYEAVSVKIESKKSLEAAPIATSEVVTQGQFPKHIGKATQIKKAMETEQQQTITDTLPSSEPEYAQVTYDDVKKATNALSAAKGRDVTIDTLSRFGVKRATELDAGQWADYIAYTEKVIADE